MRPVVGIPFCLFLERFHLPRQLSLEPFHGIPELPGMHHFVFQQSPIIPVFGQYENDRTVGDSGISSWHPKEQKKTMPYLPNRILSILTGIPLWRRHFHTWKTPGFLHPYFRIMTSLPFSGWLRSGYSGIEFEPVLCVMVHERPVFGGDHEFPPIIVSWASVIRVRIVSG